MHFQKFVQKSLHIHRIKIKIHQEIVDPAKESTPLKKITANTNQKSLVCFRSLLQYSLPEQFPEILFINPVKRGESKTTPADSRHFMADIVKAGRVPS